MDATSHRPLRFVAALAALALLAGCPDDGDGNATPDVTTDAAPDTDVTGDASSCSKEAPAGAPCNPYCQTGCEAGQHCTLVPDNFTFTCLGFGAGVAGDVCEYGADCAEGLSCFRLQGEDENHCRIPCIDGSECDGGTCSLTVTFPNNSELTICSAPLETCDVFGDPTEECGAGNGCYRTADGPVCAPAGALAEGATCDADGPTSCEAGLQCLVVCTDVCSTAPGGLDGCSACPEASFEIDEDLSLGICITSEAPEACDPFAQSGCDAGDACTLVAGGVGCRPAGSVTAGGTCASPGECAAGTICIGQVCRTLCNAAAGAPASEACDQICASGSSNLVPSEWGFGVCNGR